MAPTLGIGSLVSPVAMGREGEYAAANEERLRQASIAMTQSGLFAAAFVLAFTLFVDVERAYISGGAIVGFASACLMMRRGVPNLGKLVSFSTATLTVAAMIASYGLDSQAQLMIAPLVLPAYTCFAPPWQRTIAMSVCAVVLAAAYANWLTLVFPVAPARPAHLDLVFVAIVMVMCYWMVDDLLCVDRDFRVRSRAYVTEIESRYELLDADAARMRGQSVDLIAANETLKREIAHGQSIQRQLRASNEQLEQFVYAASHDLKEPLRSISGFLQLIRRKIDHPADPELQEYFDFVLVSAARMMRLLDGLLAYSRAGKAEVTAEWVDLDRLLIVIQHDLREALSRSGGTIDIHGGSLGSVFAAKRPLSELLRELIDNALKFAPLGAPPIVTISVTRAADGSATIAISDRGIGVEPEFRERVFQLFQRLQHVDDYEGAGIGLALARRLANTTRAQVNLVDTPDGVGIRAEICLASPAPISTGVALAPDQQPNTHIEQNHLKPASISGLKGNSPADHRSANLSTVAPPT